MDNKTRQFATIGIFLDETKRCMAETFSIQVKYSLPFETLPPFLWVFFRVIFYLQNKHTKFAVYNNFKEGKFAASERWLST